MGKSVTPKSEVERAMEKLTLALKNQYAASQEIIEAEDGKIHLPKWMTAKDGAQALMKYWDSMEEETQERVVLEGHVDDCLNACITAIERGFGQAMGASQIISTWFGDFLIPARTHTITVGYNETKTVPIGRIEIPGLPLVMDISFDVNKNDVTKSKVELRFDFKKMYQPLVDKIRDEARKVLRTESIFQGQAINSDFTFINLESFNLSKIVYSRQEERSLNAMLFKFVESYEHFTRKLGVPTKRVILLTGRYGTGKTLTALKAGRVCRDNAWTFINVLPGHDFVQAINFAKKFQPAMVFFEDIDAQTDTDKRTTRMNEILNTLDGALSKDSKIVVVLTTNHLDRVNRAMTRPGRIDAFIEMGVMDEQAIAGLVRTYVGEEVASKCDAKNLLAASKDFTPAFVVEALSRVKLFAAADGRDEITEDDVVSALEGIRAQYDEMMAGQTVDRPGLQDEFKNLVRNEADESVKAALEDFKSQLNPKVLVDQS